MGNLSPNSAQSGTPITGVAGTSKMTGDVMLWGNTGPLGSQVNPLAVQDLTEVSAKAGMSFWATSGYQSVGLNGNLRGTLSNPANSNINAILKAVVTVNSVGTFMQGSMFVNPTSNLPIAAPVLMNTMLGGPAQVSTFKADLGAAMAAGSGYAMPTFTVPQGRTVFNTSPIVIPPGFTLGLNLAFTLAAVGEIGIFFTEQPAGLFVANN